MDIKNKFTWIFSLVLLILVSTSLSVMAAIQLGTEAVTFTQPIVVSTPTLPTHAATKAYIDSAVAGTSQGTVTSVGTGSGLTGGPITSSGTISVDSTVIRTTGDQTLGGIKTFSSAVVLNTAGTATNHAVRADRSVLTGSGLTGGGNLTANRTLTVDSTVIRTTGDQTLGGIKTFSSPVVVATPTGSTHATTKAYVDTAVSNAASKWVLSGTNIYNSNSGNVGIGTSSPGAKLDVRGSILATGNVGNWGNFTVGGDSSTYYAVQFRNDAPGTSVSNDLMIYRSNVHTNGSWYGTFFFKLSFHPTNCGHFDDQIEKIEYRTGKGSPYNDPVGSIVDGTSCSNGDDVIIWLKGGATYEWRTLNGGGWTLLNGNSAGGSITDSAGNVRDPITSQSSLIINAKNRFYTNSLSLGTAGSGYFGGNVGIGTTSPGYKLDVNGTGRFTSAVIVGTPTATNHATTKAYVDSAITNIGIGGYVPTSRTIATGDGLTGGGNLTANRTLTVNSTVVRTTGDQTLGGIKTFSSAVVLSTAGTATNHAVRADRSVLTGSGLTGGGNLTANRTLTVDSTVIRTTGDQTLGGTKTFSSPVVASYYNVNSGNGNGLRFWASDNYKISMGNTAEYKYGSVTDYSIKMNMNNDATRGWTWGVVGVAPVAAINTQGHMQIAGNLITIGKIGVGVTAPTEKLEVNGNVLANAYFYTSDIRLKENVSNVENSLSKILQLQGISYNLKGDEQKRIGFSAQELQKIYPELVRENNDGYLSIDGSGLIAPLVEAIKEQQKEIEALKKKVEELSKD